jgi:hypothetical protein
MTVSDSQVQFSSQQKRRNTLTYRATLDLETEACAALQDSGAFDLRQVSNKSGTHGPFVSHSHHFDSLLFLYPTQRLSSTEEFVAVEYASDESEMSSSTGDLYSTHSGLV